jgi:hypothetical protein
MGRLSDCGELSEGNFSCNRQYGAPLRRSDGVVSHPGHVCPLPVSLSVWKTDDDQRPDDTRRGSRIAADVRLPSGAKHGRRLFTIDVVAADLGADTKQCRRGASDAFTQHRRRLPGCYHCFHPGFRLCGGQPIGPAGPSSPRRSCGYTRRKERERAPSAARRSHKRGGSSARQTMALSGRAMHVGRPALSRRPDQTVRNSCVRGKER